MIRVEKVCKVYNQLKAVNQLSFDVRQGNIFGLLGPNGAGKTTTIRMILNILKPDSGQILFSDKPLTNRDKAIIGYIPEERGLYPKVKLRDMLQYFTDLKVPNRKRNSQNIQLWLKKLDLWDHREKKIEELSKGMTQKAQFVMAVAHNPDILILDEPFSGLDPISSDLIKDCIVDLSHEGKLVLFSSHNMDNVERLCEYILLLNKGDTVLSGKTADIKKEAGSSSIILEYKGNISFLENYSDIVSMNKFTNYVEIELTSKAKPQDLLKTLIGRVEINKFEVVNPSIHKIFVDTIQEQQKKQEIIL